MLELQVLAGDPSAEEIAAVTVVLLSGSGADVAGEVPAPVSRWRASAIPGAAGRPGPGAWRASALPAQR
ncbi:acyl-CoA carboxylase subunit epsilon [Virgisporangium aurantiacum]|uniref:acyl-CoA carboxylase subunit epsilon n=1 Tax=Virgisporangium aurantiacum TaxID=175570 RepID=UPI001EF1781A|nr:acyl-CoA carboxylase subunit epsilon [Virgisporangium aurantiacum]